VVLCKYNSAYCTGRSRYSIVSEWDRSMWVILSNTLDNRCSCEISRLIVLLCNQYGGACSYVIILLCGVKQRIELGLV